MTERDKKDIIGYIEAYPDVYDKDTIEIYDNSITVMTSDDENDTLMFTTPDEARQDILEYLYGVPKGVL